MEDRILKHLVNKVAQFIVFLLVLILLNIFINYFNIPLVVEIILFLNKNVPVLGLMLLLMTLGEVFMMLNFPFNFPGPLFNSGGSVFIIYFIRDIFAFLIEQGHLALEIPFDLIFLVIAALVFMIFLITGYVSVFKSIPRQKVSLIEECRRKKEEEIEKDDRNEKINAAEKNKDNPPKSEKQTKLPLKKKIKKIKKAG